MVVKSKKDRIAEMISAIKKAAAGDHSVKLDVSPAKDEMDLLADAINKLLKKAGKPDTAKSKDETVERIAEERYRNILESMQEAYFETDLQGNMLFYNDRVTAVLGYIHQEISGMSFKQLVNKATEKKLYETFSNVYLTGEAIRGFEWQVIKKNGELIDVESSVALLRHQNGKPRGFIGAVRNITKRKQAETKLRQSEERYRNILDSIEESYFEVDLKGNLQFFNDTVMRDLGYTAEDLKGLNFQKLVDKENSKKVYEVFHNVFITGESIKGFDWEILRKNGTKLDVESSVSLRRDERGKSIGFRGIVRDISKRKHAEQALNQSESRYRMITDNIRDTIWTVDFNLNYTYISPSVQRLTGYTAEELSHIPLREQMTPSSFALVEKIMSEEFAAENGMQPRDPNASRNMELEIIRKDGTTLWEEVIVSFSRDNNGKPIEILGVTRDISERKKMEEALKESEKRYRMIVENMRDTIWTLNFDLEYTYQSPSEIRVTGFTAEEMMQIPVQDQLTPESFAMAAKILEEELELEFSGKPVDPHRYRTMELEVYKKNGGTILEEVTATFNRDESGKPLEIMFTGRDITARRKAEVALKESEKRFRLIVENMHDVIWTTDLNLRYTYISPASKSLIGYTLEEINSMPMRSHLTAESWTLVEKIFTEELAIEFGENYGDPNRSRTFEVEVVHKDGNTIWAEVTAAFNRDENGKAVGLLLAGRNITERKKMQAEKEKLEEQLLHAQKMESVGRLAGGVAHDFNNMLNVILGYAELSKMRLNQDDPVMHNIVEIEKAASRSRDITSQLLAFSRKQIIAPKIINLNEQIAGIEKTIARLIGEDISLFFHKQSDLWNIRMDPSQVEQILFNLIINARDAMQGGGKLTVETVNIQLDESYCLTHADFQAGQYVLLTVSDNGHGIDTETLKHIFEPFFTTKETGKGTGLGLATVYGIIKQNGGFVNVYSEPGQGTAVKIYFCRTEEAIPPEEVEEELIARASGTILLVEDDLPLREMTTEMLETIGYTVITVESPMEALSLCEKRDKHIDLVITDVVMPEMNGRELRDQLAIVRPDIKVLFMSGYTTNVIAHHGVLEKGVHFLQKPFSMKTLARKISEVTAG